MGELDLERGSITKAVEAASAVHGSSPSLQASNTPSSSKPLALDKTVHVLTKERKISKPLKFRPDAKIWQLYLEDAEEKANDKAELWRTGLDSLLIFAGLFAGVVSSFVIDARRDLQSDSEQRLLTGILDFLRTGSAGDIFGIPTSAYWVSGLWVVSLFVTIFSAIMGVLAKAWLAKYVPATTRREAKDAYRRYKLDKQSERWHLKEVLILVPLLVQVASVLFLAGLVLQLFGDSVTVGRALLCFCVLGGVVYFAMTVVPLIIPSSPFNTPLSEMFEALFGDNPEFEDRSPYKTDIDEGLGEILYTKLIQSPKPLHVDEAFAEVALPAFPQDWIHILCQNDTPKILLTRLRQCATSRTSDTLKRNETLSNYLLVFLAFAELYEKQLMDASKEIDVQPYKTLNEVMQESLQPGNPLHRWNELPEALRPLLFAIRTNVILLLRLPYSNPWAKTPSDINANELPDRPWEMVFQDIASSQRIHFTVAACRGLVAGERRLKTISSFILSLLLAKAAFIASETGRTSEWASGINQKEREGVIALAMPYLSELYDATVKSWDRMAADALEDLISMEVPLGDTDTARSTAGVLRSLIFSLDQQDCTIKIHALKMIKHVLSPEQSTLLSGLLSESIQSIAAMAVYNDQDGVQEDGLELLTELSRIDDMALSISRAIMNSVRWCFSQYEEQPRIAAVRFIEAVAVKGPECPFSGVLVQVIPKLVSAALDTLGPGSDRARGLAMNVAQSLHERGFPEIKQAVLTCLNKVLSTGEYGSRYELVRSLQVLFKAKDFPRGHERPPSTFAWSTPTEFIVDAVTAMLPQLLSLAIYEGDPASNACVLDIMASVARDDRFRDLRRELDLASWLDVTSPAGDWKNRCRAISVVQEFCKNSLVAESVVKKLTSLALGDTDEDVRLMSLQAITHLMRETNNSEEFARTIKESIVSDSPERILSRETDRAATVRWILIVIDIAKQVTFPESIPFLVDHALRKLPLPLSEGGTVKPKIIEFLTSSEFANDATLHEAFKKLIPAKLCAQRVLDQEVAKWVEILVALNCIESLQQLVFDALSPVRENVRYMLDSAGVQRIVETGVNNEDVDYTSDIAAEAHLRRLLDNDTPTARRDLAIILVGLGTVFPDDLLIAKVSKIAIEMVYQDRSRRARQGLLRFLQSLAETGAASPKLWEVVTENLNTLVQDDEWKVRQDLAKLLAAIALLKEYRLPDEAIIKLAEMALNDEDYDVRCEAVNALAALVSDKGRYPEAMRLAIEGFNTGIRDQSWEPRLSWLERIAPLLPAKHADSPWLAKVLFDSAVSDNYWKVRNAALDSLEGVLANADPKTRESMASQLGKYIADSLKEQQPHSLTLSVLTRLTRPISQSGSKDDIDKTATGHDTWIQIIVLLGQNDFKGVPKLIEVALKESSTNDFTRLAAMFDKVKLQEHVQTMLPQYLESALKHDASPYVCPAVDLFSRLAGVGGGGLADENLLAETNDAQIVSKLTNIAIEDDDRSLRRKCLIILKSLLTDTNRFPDLVKSSLSKAIESCFKDPELMKYRFNAITAIRSLTEPSAKDKWERFSDVVSPSIPHVLKIALLVPDREQVYLQKGVEDILLDNLAASSTETKLNRDVLSAIPSMIPSFTVEGRYTALKLAETVQVSDDTAASIAHSLEPLLRNSSAFARSIAIELLSRLYLAHRSSRPRMIESAIPEIIALALDEKDDVGDIRTTAIRLLVALSTAPTTTDDEKSSTSSSMHIPVVKQIVPLATRFMGLLQKENLRPSVVELLSLMATEAKVRRTISLKIIALVPGTDNAALQGHTQLLARLISDGRFGNEPIDKVMILVASAFITKPKLAPYRFEILTALWCRYRSNVIMPAGSEPEEKLAKQNDLVDWFTFSLFGRHATAHEVRTWLTRCKKWLPDDDSYPWDHQVAPAFREETTGISEQRGPTS